MQSETPIALTEGCGAEGRGDAWGSRQGPRGEKVLPKGQ